MTSIQPMPVKTLLNVCDQTTTEATISFENALQLGLTVTSAFLQLYSTNWIDGDWSTNQILTLSSGSTATFDAVYIPVVFQKAAVASTTSEPNESNKLLALASIILTLGLDKRFEDLQGKRDGANPFYRIQRWLAKTGIDSLDEASPCFREAAAYCLHKHQTGMKLTDMIQDQEFANRVVYPFFRDLQHSQEVL
ncbi:hypothetical protein B0A48_12435 [Cryoendolithus antarcticus]|uniref:Uncharacterized protein n=1 Tax=Cryoendolithus antarcticus TaxID=1507870 RepID=A0A1V8SST5_9PEZI|nr:hypothetical protein B0A48_12435 [Cryoendolithus antarcticus]